MISYPDKRNLKKKGFVLAHSFRVHFIIGRNSWQQNLEVASHIAFIVEMLREMNAYD